MEIVSLCPLAAAARRYQPRMGAWAELVVCKATFQLRPTEAVLAPYQDPVNEEDRHHGDDASGSLYAASDFAPTKRRADVVLVGHAFARGGVPVRSLIARLVVGEADKGIEVCSDRAFSQDGLLLQGPRFTHMPLEYERAAGGPDTSNPVGVRPGVRDMYGKIALPNLQPPGKMMLSPDDVIEPVGFGPIAPTWPQRRDKLGRHALTFPHKSWHLQPLPHDISASYFNCAPLDQQVQAIRDNERIVLEHLHPEHPRLITSLPGIRPRVFVETYSATRVRELSMRCDTLWIDTDRAICTLTWRGHLPLQHPDEQGRIIVALEQRGHEITWSDVQRSLEAMFDIPDEGVGEQTVEMSSRELRPALPFADGSGDRITPVSMEPPQLALTPAFAQPAVAVPAAVVPQAPAPVHAAPQAPAIVHAAPLDVSLRSRHASEPVSPWASGVPVDAPLRSPPITPQEPAPMPAQEEPQNRGPAAAPRPITGEVRAARQGARDVLDLVFFDPQTVPRIRKKPSFRSILDALEDKAPDPDLDDPALVKEIAEAEDRRDVFEVLAHAEASDGDGLQRELSEAIREDGKFVAPLVLAAGELVFPFQELEILRVTVAAVVPLAVADERLQAAVDAAKQFLSATEPPGLAPLTEGFLARVRDAYAQGKHPVSPEYLAAHIERALLEQRLYQRRDLFGERHIRALLHAQGSPPIPAYVPDSVAKQLPMFQRFKARLIAEVRLPAEHYEAQPLALRVLALARVAPPVPKR